ncbi:hypothetical protein FGB62_44g12 [Gracilaria domingensis]|nr:hypothetical protein FGB62_44g12 [Gracilaria domingensis]
MKSVEERLAAWADVASLLLLCVAIVVHGGIDPRRRVWGRSPIRNALNMFFMTLNIVFSAGRLIAEGVLVETGPREFLLLAVIYSARWLWLYAAITKFDSRAARAFKVAQELRRLKTVRLGRSTSETRRGERELVIRRGARTANGKSYWRGIEEYVKQSDQNNAYKVRLVERELHAGKLDEIGTVEFRRKLGPDQTDNLYRKFYDLVMTVETSNRELVLDFSAFLERHRGVPETSRLPQRVGATEASELGNVARRVAADACFYILNSAGELRTAEQVDLINETIENAAIRYMGIEDMGRDPMNRRDSPYGYNENDCNCFGNSRGTELPV